MYVQLPTIKNYEDELTNKFNRFKSDVLFDLDEISSAEPFFIKEKDMNKTMLVLKTGREYIIDMTYQSFVLIVSEFKMEDYKDKLLIKTQ